MDQKFVNSFDQVPARTLVLEESILIKKTGPNGFTIHWCAHSIATDHETDMIYVRNKKIRKEKS